MLEAFSLVAFAGVVYVFLVVVPVAIEKLSSKEFRQAYFAHLSDKNVHSFGK